jgi:hypothetical protein
VSRSPRMKALVVVALAAAIAVPAAFAKGKLTMRLGDATPRVGQAFTVDVRTSWRVPPLDYLRLIAVAPGKDVREVVGAVTGDASQAHATVPRDGFPITLRRAGPRTWRAVVKLPRPGEWRLVVPNGTKDGFTIPPPLLRRVTVS